MAFYLRNGTLLFETEDQVLSVEKLPLFDIDYSHTKDSFAHKSSYEQIVNALTNIISKISNKNNSDIIVGLDLLKFPGLFHVLKSSLSTDFNIYSSLHFILNNQLLPITEYTLLDVSKYATNRFDILTSKESFTVTRKTEYGNEELNNNLIDSFRNYLHSDLDKNYLLDIIFDYSNILLLNELLVNLKLGTGEDELAYKERNLYFKNSQFKKIFTPELLLPTFFEIISTCIFNHATRIETPNKIIIQSPILNYRNVEALIKKMDSTNSFITIDEINLLTKTINEKILSNLKIASSQQKSALTTQKSNIPFSSWVLTDTNDFKFKLLYNNSNLLIDLSALKDVFSNSMFFLKDQQLVKCHVSIDEDSNGDLLLNIRDLNGAEYFKLIQDC